MYVYGAFLIIITIIGLVIYNEIKQNKQYQKEREERLKRQRQRRKDTLQVRVKPKEANKQSQKPKEQPKPPKPQPIAQPKPEIKPEPKPKIKPEVKTKPSVELPECNYPQFDHSRLLEMGLGENDAQEFVGDLINQIEDQLPKINDAIEDKNVENIERLTHSIKGSSTNIGVGGVADLLVEFNTYTKTKSNIDVIKEYFKQLKVYLEKLKKQYS